MPQKCPVSSTVKEGCTGDPAEVGCEHAFPFPVSRDSTTDLPVSGTLGSQAVDVHRPSHQLIPNPHTYSQLPPSSPEAPHFNFDLKTDSA